MIRQLQSWLQRKDFWLAWRLGNLIAEARYFVWRWSR